MNNCVFAGQCSCPCPACSPLPPGEVVHCEQHGPGCHHRCTPLAEHRQLHNSSGRCWCGGRHLDVNLGGF